VLEDAEVSFSDGAGANDEESHGNAVRPDRVW
jgi:hypothetical protein